MNDPKQKAKNSRTITSFEADDDVREWLTVWLALGVPLVPRKWGARLLAVRRAAGLDPWPQNVLRHSRVSYRLAQTGNAAQTAIEDGHSEAMLHAHYSALVTPEAAERYFGIRPGVENFPSDSTGTT